MRRLEKDGENKLWWVILRRRDWKTYRGVWLSKTQHKSLFSAMKRLVIGRI